MGKNRINNKQRRLDFFDVDYISIVQGKTQPKISSIIMKDIKEGVHTFAEESEYTHEIEYFANFKLLFSDEVILPNDNTIENIEIPFDTLIEEIIAAKYPTNMPWKTERALLRIPGEEEYFDVFSNSTKTLTEKALYWICEDDSPCWKVVLFLRNAIKQKWYLYPFFSHIQCKTNTKNGLGIVKDILLFSYISEKIIDLNSQDSSEIKRINLGLLPLLRGISHCLFCLSRCNSGSAYLIGEKFKYCGNGTYEKPKSAALYREKEE